MGENIVTVLPGENWFSIGRTFEAPRRLVYKCYTEPQHMAHFWGPRGSSLEVCSIDLRVGGVWRIRWRFPNGDGWGYSSVYLEIQPDRSLHYRDAPYEWNGGLEGLPPVDLLSTISLSDTASGGTEVFVRVEDRHTDGLHATDLGNGDKHREVEMDGERWADAEEYASRDGLVRDGVDRHFIGHNEGQDKRWR